MKTRSEIHNRKSLTFKVLSIIVKKGIIERKDMHKLLDEKFKDDSTRLKSARLACLSNLMKIDYIIRIKRGLYKATPKGMEAYISIKNKLS